MFCNHMFLSLMWARIACFGIQPTLSLTNVQQWHNNAWNMAKAFGKQHHAKYWVLHYKDRQDSSWKKLWHSITKQNIKENNKIGYFAANELSYENSSKHFPVTNGITAHLYVNPDFKPLKHMILTSSKRRNSHSGIWLIQMPYDATKNSMMDQLNDTGIAYNSNTFCFSFMENGIIDIYDAYKVKPGLPAILKKFGSWSPLRGLTFLDSNIWPRRSSLEGMHIKVVSVYNPPLVTAIEDNCTSNACFKGTFPDVWHTLSQQMNFTYTVSCAYQWGSFVNGTWNGMVGQVEKGIYDVAVADLTITKDRSTVVNFLPSLKEAKVELFMKTPNDSIHWNAYLLPFTSQVWFVLLLWIVAVPFLLGVIMFFGEQQDSNRFGMSYCFWFVAESFMMRGGMLLPNSNSNRISFGTVLLGGIMIYYCWEADLISYLTVKRNNLPFSNLYELAENSKLRVIVIQGTSHVDEFRLSKDPGRNKIWKQKIEPYFDDLPLVEIELDVLLNDPFAVAVSEGTMKQSKSFEKCEIIDCGIVLSTSKLAWATRPKYPFYNAFKYHIQKLKEIGEVQRKSKRYEPDNRACQDYSGQPITANQSSFVFKVLFVGMLGSLLWLVLEKILPREQMNFVLTLGNQLRCAKNTNSMDDKTNDSRYAEAKDGIIDSKGKGKRAKLLQHPNQKPEINETCDEEIEVVEVIEITDIEAEK